MSIICFIPLALAPLLVGSPAGARVFFISLTDGNTVTNPVHAAFGIGGVSVVPAGDDAQQMAPGDHLHIPHDPPVGSEQITIQVE